MSQNEHILKHIFCDLYTKKEISLSNKGCVHIIYFIYGGMSNRSTLKLSIDWNVSLEYFAPKATKAL